MTWPDMPEEAQVEEAAMHVDEWDQMLLEDSYEQNHRRRFQEFIDEPPPSS